jgi:hypothetical protein
MTVCCECGLNYAQSVFKPQDVRQVAVITGSSLKWLSYYADAYGRDDRYWELLVSLQ